MNVRAPLRACLLSGGASRRMGRDKALLPHPQGRTWLERTLLLLAGLEIPITVLSRHRCHLQLARALAVQLEGPAGPAGTPRGSAPAQNPEPSVGSAAAAPASPSRPQAGKPSPALTLIAEPEPWQGPLLALHRLMQHHPDQRLLLCPVDMPWLTSQVLQTLLELADGEPERIHLAHDGERRQPLLGVYPSPAAVRMNLSGALRRGERRLQGWLAGQICREVHLDPAGLRNINRPEQLVAGAEPGGSARCRADSSAPARGAEPADTGHCSERG